MGDRRIYPLFVYTLRGGGYEATENTFVQAVCSAYQRNERGAG